MIKRDICLGLLVNFRRRKVEYKRLRNQEIMDLKEELPFYIEPILHILHIFFYPVFFRFGQTFEFSSVYLLYYNLNQNRLLNHFRYAKSKLKVIAESLQLAD